jgi:uncharacterized delta-60 repeat protein
VRLTSSGSIDNTFSIGTGFNGVIRAITIQSDGKVLIGGEFTSYSGTTRNRLIRLNSDGSIDLAFSIGTGFNNTVRTVAIQSDGKILVGGDFTAYNGVTRNYTIRLNSDGSRDDTFNIGTGFNNTVRTVAIQSDGKVLIGGNFTLYNGTTKNRIIRLNSNGSIDSTFKMGTGFPQPGNYVQVIQLQPDGKFFVSGNLRSYNIAGFSISGDYFRENLIKLNSDGSLDTTFVPYQFNIFAMSIQTQSNGKILMGSSFGILRLTETGLNSTDDGIGFTKFFIVQASSNQYNNIPNGIWLSPNDEVVKIKSYLPINKSMISYKLTKIK